MVIVVIVVDGGVGPLVLNGNVFRLLTVAVAVGQPCGGVLTRELWGILLHDKLGGWGRSRSRSHRRRRHNVEARGLDDVLLLLLLRLCITGSRTRLLRQPEHSFEVLKVVRVLPNHLLRGRAERKRGLRGWRNIH